MLIKSMALGAALIAAPVAFAQTSPQTTPGQTMPGQTTPGQTMPGQTMPGQTTPGMPASPTTPGTPTTTPDATATDSTAATTPAPVTDAEVTLFATAALAVTKVQADPAISAAEKNAKSIEAITAAGIEPTRFNEISEAMRNDPALNQRIQTAAAAATQPAQ